MHAQTPLPLSPSVQPAGVDASVSAVVVAACAVLSFTGACFTHEMLGHAGACLAGSGTVLRMTSSLFACQPGILVADLGGPGANLLLGIASVMLLRRLRPGSITHLLTLLSAAFNLFWLAGCLLESAFLRRGDFAYAERLASDAQVMLRVPFGIAAIVIGATTCRLLGRQNLSRRVYWLAYVVAGATACASVLFAAGPLVPALREAAFESLGSMAWLLLVRPRPEGPPPERPAVGDNPRRVVAPALLALGLLLALGHGIDTPTMRRPDRPADPLGADGASARLSYTR